MAGRQPKVLAIRRNVVPASPASTEHCQQRVFAFCLFVSARSDPMVGVECIKCSKLSMSRTEEAQLLQGEQVLLCCA